MGSDISQLDPTEGVTRTPDTHSRLSMKLAALVLAVVLPLAALEMALRLRQYWKYGTARIGIITLRYNRAADLTLPVPGAMTRGIWINSLGFRSPELVNPRPKGTLRLAFLGGSTTFCAEVSSNEATWPHQVWKTLQQDRPDIRFDYFNAAVSGYTTVQSIRNLEWRAKPQNPDVIVIYGELTNDLSADTRKAASKQGIGRGAVDDFGPFSRWSLTWFLSEKNFIVWTRQHEIAQERQRVFHFVPQELSAPFHERLRELVVKARSVAPLVVLPTFSKKLRRNQSPDAQLRAANTMLYYNPYMTINGLLDAYDEYNRITRVVSEETGALLIGGEDSIPGDSADFVDSVHFTDGGRSSLWLAA